MTLPVLIASFFVVTAAAASFALLGAPESRRAARRLYVWLPLVLVLLVTVGGITWQERTLMHFAKLEGGTVHGLIAKPVPLTTDHRFTPNGRHYLYRGIQVPMAVTSAILVMITLAFSAIVYTREPNRVIFALWLETLAAVAVIAVWSAWRFVQAVDLFI